MQATRRDPLMPLGIFRTKDLAAGNAVMALLGAAWVPMWFFLNLFLQQVLGYGAVRGRCLAAADDGADDDPDGRRDRADRRPVRQPAACSWPDCSRLAGGLAILTAVTAEQHLRARSPCRVRLSPRSA